MVGYDSAQDQLLMHDPALEDGAYRRLDRQELYATWPLAHATGRSTIIRFRLDPGELKAPTPGPGTNPADLAQHVMRHQTLLPHRGFTVLVEEPFVVIGDGGEDVGLNYAQARYLCPTCKSRTFCARSSGGSTRRRRRTRRDTRRSRRS